MISSKSRSQGGKPNTGKFRKVRRASSVSMAPVGSTISRGAKPLLLAKPKFASKKVMTVGNAGPDEDDCTRRRTISGSGGHGSVSCDPQGGHSVRLAEPTCLVDMLAGYECADNEGRPYDLERVIVNFAKVGISFGKKFHEGSFHWEGVRRCVDHLTQERNLKVIGIIFECWVGFDGMNNPQNVNGVPDDIRLMCESIEEAPRVTGAHHRSADDEMTIKCAYRRNCRMLVYDIYGDWLLCLRSEQLRDWLEHSLDRVHMKYYFDSGLGCFETLDGISGSDTSFCAQHTSRWSSSSHNRHADASGGLSQESAATSQSLNSADNVGDTPPLKEFALKYGNRSENVYQTPLAQAHAQAFSNVTRVAFAAAGASRVLHPAGMSIRSRSPVVASAHPAIEQEVRVAANVSGAVPPCVIDVEVDPEEGDDKSSSSCPSALSQNKAVFADGSSANVVRKPAPGINELHEGWTAVCAAAYGGTVDVVSALLQQGADPNIANIHGAHPLYYAVDQWNLPLIRLLLRHGSRPIVTRGPVGESLSECVRKRLGTGRRASTRAATHRELLSELGVDISSSVSGAQPTVATTSKETTEIVDLDAQTTLVVDQAARVVDQTPRVVQQTAPVIAHALPNDAAPAPPPSRQTTRPPALRMTADSRKRAHSSRATGQEEYLFKRRPKKVNISVAAVSPRPCDRSREDRHGATTSRRLLKRSRVAALMDAAMMPPPPVPLKCRRPFEAPAAPKAPPSREVLRRRVQELNVRVVRISGKPIQGVRQMSTGLDLQAVGGPPRSVPGSSAPEAAKVSKVPTGPTLEFPLSVVDDPYL